MYCAHPMHGNCIPAINGWFTPGAIICRFAPPDWPRKSAKLFGLITLETRFVELDVSYGAFMRVGILFGVRTQSSDPEVASELSLCPTMSIPGITPSVSIPSLSAAAGSILGGAVRHFCAYTTCSVSQSSRVKANHTCSRLVLKIVSRGVLRLLTQ